MLDETAIQEAARRLATAARQTARIIPSSSYARGNAQRWSRAFQPRCAVCSFSPRRGRNADT
jgi:hypothetical protein